VCKYYGWDERVVKWGISWRNLIMYNAVIPDIYAGDSASNSSLGNNSKSVNGSISLFDIGKRLSEGKGV